MSAGKPLLHDLTVATARPASRGARQLPRMDRAFALETISRLLDRAADLLPLRRLQGHVVAKSLGHGDETDVLGRVGIEVLQKVRVLVRGEDIQDAGLQRGLHVGHIDPRQARGEGTILAVTPTVIGRELHARRGFGVEQR